MILHRVSITRATLAALCLGLLGAAAVNAADARDLKPLYTGATFSTTVPDFEVAEASLTINSRGTRGFTGVFNDGGWTFAVSGGVGSNGRAVFLGSFIDAAEGTSLQIRGEGQLSVLGNVIVGSASEIGRLEGRAFRDVITYVVSTEFKGGGAPKRK